MKPSPKKKLLIRSSIKSKRPIVPPGFHSISDEELKYFQKALRYAIDKGYKITLFDENGNITGRQG